ncbi:TrkH family potassium uptake protein [Candidatus Magnetaquicoccus inordinatus]|uniref:TrkH family potassium uptake protein n=1 Tax=Candidatus Magnetaquicoccus inordinatus TaxID=2496818 RepID=UPI00102B6964|nr:TrkH family potassium uptake protein [Candidatus Magnetaquicoccus inordinatus]
MNLMMNIRVLSLLATLLSFSQIPAVLVALLVGETPMPFIQSMAVGAACGLLYFATSSATPLLRARDGILIVGLGWILATVLAGLPFVFGGWMGWIDSWFETASGFTTTGASILTDVEILPKSQLFWRSEIQWLGGMGILLLAIAILPFLGVGGMEILKAEVPGPTKDRLVPRVATTARILWVLYFAITVANIVAFMASDMDFLESVDHAFATMATGGFSTRNASLAAFSPSAQWWCTFFMFVAGANFLLHYRLFFRRDWGIFKDPELKTYFGIVVVASLICGFTLMVAQDKDLELSMRQAFFNVVSVMTTTGFANDDFAKWPLFLQVILLNLMIIGGMAGSTAGGVKVIRLVMVWQLFQGILDRLMQPRRITLPKYAGTVIPPEVMEGSLIMVVIFLFVMLLSVIVLTAVGLDFTTAFSASLACLANVGPGIAKVGPVENYAFIHDVGKLLLTVTMIAGRLELFTILILFFPRFWKST